MDCWKQFCVPGDYRGLDDLPPWLREIAPTCSVFCQLAALSSTIGTGGKTPQMKTLEREWKRKLENGMKEAKAYKASAEDSDVGGDIGRPRRDAESQPAAHNPRKRVRKGALEQETSLSHHGPEGAVGQGTEAKGTSTTAGRLGSVEPPSEEQQQVAAVPAAAAAVAERGGQAADAAHATSSQPPSKRRKGRADAGEEKPHAGEDKDSLYHYSTDGRPDLLTHPWKKEGDVPVPKGATRASYGDLVEHVRRTLTVGKDSVDPLCQIWYRELMKRAAGFTTWASVGMINHRQPPRLQTRAYVSERVDKLVRNFDAALMSPAVVVVQDVFQEVNPGEDAPAWSGDEVTGAMQLKAEWEVGRARGLYAAVEGVQGAPSVHAFTVVGNHSTAAASRANVYRREAYVFFRSGLSDDDFKFLSRTENDMAKASAETTALYYDYKRPLRLVPFLRQLWQRHGRPLFKGHNQDRYSEYLKNLSFVLEQDPVAGKKGSSAQALIAETDHLRRSLQDRLVAADSVKGKEMELKQQVRPTGHCGEASLRAVFTCIPKCGFAIAKSQQCPVLTRLQSRMPTRGSATAERLKASRPPLPRSGFLSHPQPGMRQT